jgi:hypothetical protein
MIASLTRARRLPAALLGLVLVLLGLAWPTPALSGCGLPRPKETAKNIDLAICLDVSNSMDGLIGSAKAKLWDIVNDLAKIKPTPNLRVALFSYGNDGYDPKVGWIRKDLDLTTDLDSLYQKLFALTTRGGTEYVTRVCRDATAQLKWSEDPKALKIIFVCGNEPASQDPLVKLKEAADKAIARGIVINPIYCGNHTDNDARDWKEFAALCGGRFASINQEGGTVAIATPHDKELAELSGKLNTTYVPYGRVAHEKALNQAAQDANAVNAGSGVAAARAVSKASGLYRNEEWDLVDRLKKDPKFDVKKVPETDLPESLRKMKPEEREAKVKKMAAQRDSLQKQIAEVNVKRLAYVAEQLKKNASTADKAFDAAVRGALREQAASKGIKIPD